MQADTLKTILDPKPWIGSAYLRQPMRVLVLGESHKMSDGDDIPTSGLNLGEYTVRSITWRILGRGHSPFFANVEQIMFDEPGRLDQPGNGDAEIYARSDFWHSVAFSNFVPRIMSDQTEKPSPADFRNGTDRLLTLMRALEPDLVCLFSAKAFEHRPWGEPPKFDGWGAEPEHVSDHLTRYPRANGTDVFVARFPHPSRTSPSQLREQYLAVRRQVQGLLRR